MHDDANLLVINEVVRRLNNHLGTTLVAALAGTMDLEEPERWANPDGPPPREGEQERIRVAHRIWLALADAESDDLARTWFTGTNPFLDGESPVLALREGQARDVTLAAKAFLDGTWSA